MELTLCRSSSLPDPREESDRLSPSQCAVNTSILGSFNGGPFVALSSRSSESFKPLKDMHMSQSFISINSFKHFVCFCSCFPEF